MINVAISEHINKHFIGSILILGLQIEGIIRSILSNQNVNTTITHSNGTIEEKSLGRLLGSRRTKKILSEDLVEYLDVLLIRKEGANLRNRLAHALTRFEEYTEDLSSLLILTLLYIDNRTL